MNISFIGKFARLHDEEYIARSFEAIGCNVQRVEEGRLTSDILNSIEHFNPDFVLFTKLAVAEPKVVLDGLKQLGYPTVSWLFDLYFNYAREYRVKTAACFKADLVVSTDGGHDYRWKELGIDHICIRQGIYKEECYLDKGIKTKDVVFVGSDNPMNKERTDALKFIQKNYKGFEWIGKNDTNEIRGTDLNKLYAQTKIVVGDSVYSPFYWSNRVVETLGRGGFLIHQDVEGLKEEYPHLVTYKRGDLNGLKAKIDYYLEHDEEREEIVKKNFELVKERYTMDKKCAELLSKI